MEERRVWRLGVVSYLNSRPLVHGLEEDPRVDLRFGAPARLAEWVDRGVVDAALTPIVDLLAPDRDWRIVSDACIGCNGETLTVRVFSRIPAERIHRLHVDGDSRTSVVLARVVWRETHGIDLELVPRSGSETPDACEAVLLIGDKVVTRRPTAFEIEIDLGAAWKSLTGLPFVFAAWAAPRGREVEELADLLSHARDRGVKHAEAIAEEIGPGMGWPVSTARRYLTKRLIFTMGPQQREGMRRFLELTKKHGWVAPAKELVFA